MAWHSWTGHGQDQTGTETGTGEGTEAGQDRDRQTGTDTETGKGRDTLVVALGGRTKGRSRTGALGGAPRRHFYWRTRRHTSGAQLFRAFAFAEDFAQTAICMYVSMLLCLSVSLCLGLCISPPLCLSVWARSFTAASTLNQFQRVSLTNQGRRAGPTGQDLT